MKIINLVAFMLMVTMNYLANALPLNNKTTGALSAQYPNLFVPAGLTFSIWGVIYLLLLAFVVLQFREVNRPLMSAIGWAFALSCLLNALWIWAWHFERLPLSLFLMLGLLAVLIWINMALRPFPMNLARMAFGIYLGWICIATIANVTAWLVSVQWGGWGLSEESWTLIMIGAGTLIAAASLLRLENPYLGLAVLWAFLGIILKRQGDYPLIVTAAIAAMLIVAVATAVSFYRRLGAA